jgi:NhaP-type Na+/H+ or K+/H+ antiporter
VTAEILIGLIGLLIGFLVGCFYGVVAIATMTVLEERYSVKPPRAALLGMIWPITICLNLSKEQ